jgi:hypothetical protein
MQARSKCSTGWCSNVWQWMHLGCARQARSECTLRMDGTERMHCMQRAGRATRPSCGTRRPWWPGWSAQGMPVGGQLMGRWVHGRARRAGQACQADEVDERVQRGDCLAVLQPHARPEARRTLRVLSAPETADPCPTSSPTSRIKRTPPRPRPRASVPGHNLPQTNERLLQTRTQQASEHKTAEKTSWQTLCFPWLRSWH